jgi:pimeloyl-ACP methyl ester carboxylesterase
MKIDQQTTLEASRRGLPALPYIEGVKHHFVEVQGIQLHIAEAGEGEPLLLLHGWPQHWYMWRHLLPELATRYRVLCPDLRGFGWSDAPSHGYEKEQLAADIIALLNTLGLERVRLIGHDWGGWLGFLLCLRHPERVQQFMALNITHPWQRLDGPVLMTLWRFWYQGVIACPGLGSWLLQHRPGFVRSAILRRSLINKRALSEEDLTIYAEHLREPARARASVALYRTFLLREFFPVAFGRYLSFSLRTPTLILFGTRDIFISSKLLRGYQSHTQTITVELVSESGHFIAEERPDLVMKRVQTFFSSEVSQGL